MFCMTIVFFVDIGYSFISLGFVSEFGLEGNGREERGLWGFTPICKFYFLGYVWLGGKSVGKFS